MTFAFESVRARRDLGLAGAARSGRPVQFYVWMAFFAVANLGAFGLLLRHHPATAAWVFVAPAPWYIWQLAVPSARGFGPAVTTFAPSGREVWLTIDDGPDPATTPRMLDLLDAHRVRATFFVIGAKADRHPELVAEILRRGHTLGNHTRTHPCFSFWWASARRTGGEIDACTAALRRTGAGPAPWFRPPAGLKSLALHPQLAARALPLVLWSVRSFDTLPLRAGTVVARLARQVRPGAIVLLHESGPRSAHHVAILAGLLAHLAREGYTGVVPAADCLRT